MIAPSSDVAMVPESPSYYRIVMSYRERSALEFPQVCAVLAEQVYEV
jgi:hypothetical protein